MVPTPSSTTARTRARQRSWCLLLLALLTSLVAGTGGLDDPEPSSAANVKAKAKTTYCTRYVHPEGCVKVPAGARRPHGKPQQSQEPRKRATETASGSGSGSGPRPGDRARALAWAKSQLGTTVWDYLCESFVEEAYGTNGVFSSAASSASVVQAALHRGSVLNAPAGTLLYFARDSTNDGKGHVGVALGHGKMISALQRVVTSDVAHSEYWRRLYRGWADAPIDWPGRKPGAPVGRGVDVRISGPSPGRTLSGEVAIHIRAPHAAGVALRAFYAANPRDATTRGWHNLGRAHPSDGGWEFTFETRSVPDQGDPQFGTVTVEAVALDASGARTPDQDVVRYAVDNVTAASPTAAGVPPGSQPSPTPTPTPTPSPSPTPTPSTVPETTGGAANTWTNYANAGGTQGPTIPALTTVAVTCKVQGFRVQDGNTWWYRIASSPWSNAYYSSADAFYNNGQTSGDLRGTPFVDPDVPLC